MPKLIIANWKTNFDLATGYKFIKQLSVNSYQSKIIIAAPHVMLSYLATEFPNMNFAAQDISVYNNCGSKTGECSAKIVNSCGINYSIIGHSERRTFFKESNQMIKKKILNCYQSDITPIICIGEDVETRKKQKHLSYIKRQINALITEKCQHLIIAYEPVWSIGTGKIPTKDQINEVFSLIKDKVEGDELANCNDIVYGGSVDKDNYKSILDIPLVSGLLIGSASLRINEFNKIISNIDHV